MSTPTAFSIKTFIATNKKKKNIWTQVVNKSKYQFQKINPNFDVFVLYESFSFILQQ